MAKKVTKTTATKKNETVLEAVDGLDAGTVVQEVGNLTVSLQQQLATVSAAITAELDKLGQVKAAIVLKEQELSDLHEIDKELLDLETLRLQRDEEVENWNKDKAARRQAWAEEESDRNKRLQREQDEYNYKTQTDRQRSKEEFEAEVARKQRGETTRRELLEKDWQSREAELTARETEIQILRDQVAGFDGDLKSAVAAAEAVVGNTLKKQAAHDLAMLQKDAENEKKLNAQVVASFKAENSALTTQVTNLQNQLEAAREDAKEITKQALESASGRQVVAALQKAQSSDPSKK